MAKISVLVPTYNRSDYLKSSIESILSQSYIDFEIIISDNASTDNTQMIVEAFNDSRIVYHKNAINMGIAPNYNQALKLAKGEYVQFFSDDDIMLNDCLKINKEVLDEYPTVGLVHSDVNILDSDGNISSPNHWGSNVWSDWSKIHNQDKFFSKEKYQEYLFNIHNTICMPSAMIRRSVVDKIGYLDPVLTYVLDWDYWIKICLFYDVFYVNKKLVSYRLHSRSETAKSNFKFKSELKYMKDKLQKDFPKLLLPKRYKILDIAQETYFYANNNYWHLCKNIIKNIISYDKP
jgi:glycosyltransferase involved in cell wall biosynthesis